MCNVKRNGVKYKISAKQYQLLKEEFSKAQSEAIEKINLIINQHT